MFRDIERLILSGLVTLAIGLGVGSFTHKTAVPKVAEKTDVRTASRATEVK